MKTCFLFHFALSFKIVSHILLLAPFQRSVCWQTDFRANYVKKHPILKVKPSNQSSPPSISNKLHTNPKTFPEKTPVSARLISPETRITKLELHTKPLQIMTQRCVGISKDYRDTFSTVGNTETDRSLTSSLKYINIMYFMA